MTDINSTSQQKPATGGNKNKREIWLALSIGASILVLVILISGQKKLGFGRFALGFILSALASFIAVLVGDMLRKIAMPDVFFSKGMMDTLQKKLFWSIGPQAIGLLLGQLLVWGLLLPK